MVLLNCSHINHLLALLECYYDCNSLINDHQNRKSNLRAQMQKVVRKFLLLNSVVIVQHLVNKVVLTQDYKKTLPIVIKKKEPCIYYKNSKVAPKLFFRCRIMSTLCKTTLKKCTTKRSNQKSCLICNEESFCCLVGDFSCSLLVPRGQNV